MTEDKKPDQDTMADQPRPESEGESSHLEPEAEPLTAEEEEAQPDTEEGSSAEEEAPVLEGEYVEARSEPDAKPDARPDARPDAAPPAQKRGGRLGWMVAFLLAGVIAGVYAAPYVQDGLVSVGLAEPAAPIVDVEETAAAQADLAAVREQLLRLREQMVTEQGVAEALERVRQELPADLSNRLAAVEQAAERPPVVVSGEGDGAGAELAGTLNDLQQRLGATRQQLDGLEQQVAQLSGPDARVLQDFQQTMLDRLADVEQRLDELPSDPATAQQLTQLAEQVALVRDELGVKIEDLAEQTAEARQALSRRLVELELKDRREQAGPGLAYEIADLQRQVIAGAPYRGDLNAVRALLEDDPLRLAAAETALKTLARAADDGIATQPELAQIFQQQMRATEQAIEAANQPQTWWERVKAQAAGIVTVRPEQAERLGGTLALLAQIDAALREGDVAGALGLINRLPIEAREQLRPLSQAANSRLETLEAVASLFQVVRPVEGEDA